MRHVISGLVLLLASALANSTDNSLPAANETFRKQLLDQLAHQTTKHFYFRQQKKIAVLNKPLVTEGELWLQDSSPGKPGTVIWDTHKPYQIRYELNRDFIREIDSAGSRTINPGTNPLAAAMTEAMMAAFSGHWEQGNTLAQIVARGTDTNWQLDITPRSTDLQKLISHLQIQGSQQLITRITIIESNNDSTTIDLRTEELPTGS